MSTLTNHKLLGGGRLIPVFYQTNKGTDTDSNYTITALSTPVTGNMMVVMAGGTQTRVVINGLPGWTHTQLNAGGATIEIFTKIVAGETTAIGNIIWDAALVGAWSYSEWINMDSNPYFTHTNASALLTFTLTYPAYFVPYASVVFAAISLGAASSSWVLDNSFLDLSYAVVGQNTAFKVGYRIYTDFDLSETTGWSSSNSRDAAGALVILSGKKTG